MIFSSRRKRPTTAPASRGRNWTSIRWLGFAGAACGLFTGAWAFAQSPTYTIRPKDKEAPKVYTIGTSAAAAASSPYNAGQAPASAAVPAVHTVSAQPSVQFNTVPAPKAPATVMQPAGQPSAYNPMPVAVAIAPQPVVQAAPLTIAPVAPSPVIPPVPIRIVPQPAPAPAIPKSPPTPMVLSAAPAQTVAVAAETVPMQMVPVVNAAPTQSINVPVQPIMVPVIIGPAPIRTVTMPLAEGVASVPASGPELIQVQLVQTVPNDIAFPPPPPIIVQTPPPAATPMLQPSSNPTPTTATGSPTAPQTGSATVPAPTSPGTQPGTTDQPSNPQSGQARPEDKLSDYGIEIEPPRLNQLYRLKTEAELRRQIAEDIKHRPQEAGTTVEFPTYRKLTDEPYSARQFGGLIKQIEPNYVAYRRLYAEERNSERFGWWLGPIQPLWSAASAWKDMALIPYKVGARPYQRFDTSAGLCYPGDPVPYLIPPPELSVPGTIAEGTLLWGLFLAIP